MAERSGSDERSVRLVSHDEMSHIAAMNTPTGGSAVGMGGGGGGGGASDDDMLESLHPGILPMSSSPGSRTRSRSRSRSDAVEWSTGRKAICAMMVCLLLVGTALVLWALVFHPNTQTGFSNDKRLLGMDSFVLNNTLNPSLPAFQWGTGTIADIVYTLADGDILAINPLTRATTVFVAGSSLILSDGSTLDFFSFSVSPDNRQVLLATSKVAGWRHSYTAIYYVYFLDTNKLSPLTTATDALQYAEWSPTTSSHLVAVVRNNDVSVLDTDVALEHRITSTGSATMFNGIPDWSYEEEVLESNSALWWSPTGLQLAFMTFDAQYVPEFSFPQYNDEAYTGHSVFRYPCPGYANAQVSLSVFNVNTEEVAVVDLDADGMQPDNRYIVQVGWMNATYVVARTLNAAQNASTLMAAYVSEGGTTAAATTTTTARIMQTQRDSAWLRSPSSLAFFSPASDPEWYFVDLVTAPNGFRHLALFRAAFPAIFLRHITSGDWEVTSVARPPRPNDDYLYYMSTQDSPMERNLYRVNALGNEGVRISTRGWQSVTFSPSGSFYVLTYSGPDAPYAGVYEAKLEGAGEQVVELGSSSTLERETAALMLPKRYFMQVPSAEEGVMLNAYVFAPPGADLKNPETKWPLLMYVYGGPGSQTVTSQYPVWGKRSKWHMYLASTGFLVASVDGRGTGGRGQAFLNTTYKHLGEKEVDDQIAAAKFFATQPYVDAQRIGMWGWSFGGYMTSRIMGSGDTVFATGMAVAPVTDWRFYDSIYTSRYMLTPQENPSGYTGSSVLPEASKFRDDTFLLIHGTGDDNVHFSNSMELVKALVQEQVLFDFMAYPNQPHALSGGGAEDHVWRTLNRYIQRKLNGPAASVCGENPADGSDAAHGDRRRL